MNGFEFQNEDDIFQSKLNEHVIMERFEEEEKVNCDIVM
jgi:hypothetical protein